MPDEGLLEQIKEAGLDPTVKRKRGRPKGSKNKPGYKSRGFPKEDAQLVDPATGLVVNNSNSQSLTIQRMGDERVTAFVQYHIDMMQMRQGVDKKNVADLYNRFYRYLAYCAEHGIIPNNINAYFAIGVVKQEISAWKLGNKGSPEHKQFAEDITQFFASVHEQAGAENIVNPILSIYWSKAHDGMIEASKLEVSNVDALGEKRSAEDIAKQYADVNLPD